MFPKSVGKHSYLNVPPLLRVLLSDVMRHTCSWPGNENSLQLCVVSSSVLQTFKGISFLGYTLWIAHPLDIAPISCPEVSLQCSGSCLSSSLVYYCQDSVVFHVSIIRQCCHKRCMRIDQDRRPESRENGQRVNVDVWKAFLWRKLSCTILLASKHSAEFHPIPVNIAEPACSSPTLSLCCKNGQAHLKLVSPLTPCLLGLMVLHRADVRKHSCQLNNIFCLNTLGGWTN
jgi:hypothetical protein